MAVSVVQVSAPWFRSSIVLLALLAANAPPVLGTQDTVAADRPLSGNGKLVSRGGKFTLGFFQPDGGAAGSWYVGIWYHNISKQTPVWVANRDQPVSDPAASRLTIAADGNLVLLDASGALAWSTNASAVGNTKVNNANSTVAVLLDTGNLVLTPSTDASNVLWRSFDHIGDTWLPGWKRRWDKVTDVDPWMTSWRGRGDPAPGPYMLQLDPTGAPQFVLLRKGTRKYYWATGDWNGPTFTGGPEFAVSSSGFCARFKFRFVDDVRESYVTYGSTGNSTVLYRIVIDVSGQLQGFFWAEDTQEWVMEFAQPTKQCSVPRYCGAFGVCSDGGYTPCSCATGFSPRDFSRWNLEDYTSGCVRNAELQCNKNSSNGDSASRLKAKEDVFFPMLVTRLPDDSRITRASSSGDCERACLSDCTCSAYAYNGSCILWNGDLHNLKDTKVSSADTGSLYLRLAAQELPSSRSHKQKTIEVAIGALVISCFVVAASVLIVRTRTARRSTKVQGHEGCVASYKYRDLQSFTKNFSDKLGGGSFGSVFRGQLPDHTTIAVKKLEGLRQGEKQFRAEVSTLGTIQHINLIRLLGFCSSGGDRKLLVYEYMPNGSLDRHLFGATLYALSWRARYQIAVGIAKGLAYLHDNCRDCIIHCDVKPENILLDADFAPKVADFGLAKLVNRDFSRVLTTMRGTIGYLAPEWIGGEPVTAKADVYSYGMMLLEIVSGKRNVVHGKTESGPEPLSGGGTGSEHAAAEFFPVLAAKRLAEAEVDVMTLLDSKLRGDADAKEVRRVCKVACWCIQDKVDVRPIMAEVVKVLEGVTEVEVPPVPRYLEILAGRWMIATDDYSS